MISQTGLGEQPIRDNIGSDNGVEYLENLYHELVDGRGQKEDISVRRQRPWDD